MYYSMFDIYKMQMETAVDEDMKLCVHATTQPDIHVCMHNPQSTIAYQSIIRVLQISTSQKETTTCTSQSGNVDLSSVITCMSLSAFCSSAISSSLCCMAQWLLC